MVEIRELSSTSSSGDMTHTDTMTLRTRNNGAHECTDVADGIQTLKKISQRHATSQPSSQVSFPPAKDLLHRFTIQEKLGEGSYGKVWRCTDRETGEVLACKQVAKSQGLEHILQEIDCLTRVQGHRNILKLQGVYESELYLFIVTEYCNGGDLFEHLMKEGGMSEESARDLFSQLVKAVQHCHSRGVIHRDIKPENILLHIDVATGQMTAKLADFGLAQRLRPGELCRGWVGSEPYEAPEVMSNKPYDFSADVFSLGVVLFCMLAANWPLFKNGREFDSRVSFSYSGWRAISLDAKNLISSMLSLDPNSRPTTHSILCSPWLLGETPTSNGFGSPHESGYTLEDALEAFQRLSLSRSAAHSSSHLVQAAPAPEKLEIERDDCWNDYDTPLSTPTSTSARSPRPSELSFSWASSKDSEICDVEA